MTTVKGKVAVVNGKKWNSITLYSFRLEDNDRWYRLGRIEPTFTTGDQIEFTERNSNVEIASIVIRSNGVSESDAESVVVTTPGGRTVSQPPVNNRIRYQAARRDAANLVVAALHTDALPWAANVAKAKKLDLLTGYVEQITKTLLEQEDNNAS